MVGINVRWYSQPLLRLRYVRSLIYNLTLLRPAVDMKRENNFLTLFPILHSNRQNKKKINVYKAQKTISMPILVLQTLKSFRVYWSRERPQKLYFTFSTQILDVVNTALYIHEIYRLRLCYDYFQNQTNVCYDKANLKKIIILQFV